MTNLVWQLKADHGTASIPINALTAHALDAGRIEPLETGSPAEFEALFIDLIRTFGEINPYLDAR